jgi:hypothetical protein
LSIQHSALGIQCPAVPLHLSDETCQHFFDLNGRLIGLYVFFGGQKTKIFGEQEMVLEFAGQSGGDVRETLELGIAALAGSFDPSAIFTTLNTGGFGY